MNWFSVDDEYRFAGACAPAALVLSLGYASLVPALRWCLHCTKHYAPSTRHHALRHICRAGGQHTDLFATNVAHASRSAKAVRPEQIRVLSTRWGQSPFASCHGFTPCLCVAIVSALDHWGDTLFWLHFSQAFSHFSSLILSHASSAQSLSRHAGRLLGLRRYSPPVRRKADLPYRPHCYVRRIELVPQPNDPPPHELLASVYLPLPMHHHQQDTSCGGGVRIRRTDCQQHAVGGCVHHHSDEVGGYECLGCRIVDTASGFCDRAGCKSSR